MDLKNPIVSAIPELLQMPDMSKMLDNPKHLPAKHICAKVGKLITQFESELNQDSEVGMSLAGLPNGVALHIREISYWNPDIIIFSGLSSDGHPAQLVQHHSQLSIMLLAVPKIEEKAFRVGFVAADIIEQGR